MGRLAVFTAIIIIIAAGLFYAYKRYGILFQLAPYNTAIDQSLEQAGFKLGTPILVRIFKKESLLEVWQQRDDKFTLFKTYPICTWSGALGPKHREGDKQSPEGFYIVTKKQLNPNSRYHRAFNIGYPNAYDKQLDRTGSALMVHGSCVSVGCYAMTDYQISEIYRIIEKAFDAGQAEFQIQIYPFRMTKEAMEANKYNPWLEFWQNLKQGNDLFEASGTPPKAYGCNGVYGFNLSKQEAEKCQPIKGW
ncbi:murein L,D-transpeptidase family protein [Microvirga sp. W0021]|uniref:Murein L,D-transpeptidase family protein n=1 Tax=Hohaiivirga grylli TaxID=3133970 RepID=A0ABV0BJE2_9HYPH